MPVNYPGTYLQNNPSGLKITSEKWVIKRDKERVILLLPVAEGIWCVYTWIGRCSVTLDSTCLGDFMCQAGFLVFPFLYSSPKIEIIMSSFNTSDFIRLPVECP